MKKSWAFDWRVAALLLLAMLAGGASAQERRLLPGHVPAVVHSAAAIGRLLPTQSLNLAIGVPLRDQPGLTRLLQAVSDPSSSDYRHYLTPEQFTERFGPTEADYQAVIAFAKAHGLAVTGIYPHRMLLDVAGSVADIEQAFHFTLRTYQHPTEARTFYAPDTEPSVEPGVPILDISGLSNFRLPHPQMRKPIPLGQSPTRKPNVTGSWPGGQFIGGDFRAAYAPGVTLTGTSQSVGILEFDGYYPGDITQYEGLANLPDIPVQVVLLDGFDGTPDSTGPGGNEEVALDIEMVIAMAPGLSSVVVYEAGPYGMPNHILSAMSTNTAIKQFSCSWSFGTTPSGTTDSLFQKLGVQGQTFLTASGDFGACIGAWLNPNDDPYITVVGGTALSTCGPGGARLSETAWNAGDGYDGTSGGYSANYPITTTAPWQQGISMTANQGSTTLRNIPDVAMVADDIFLVADNGTDSATGGTSAATPLWAAYIALANQQAALSSQPPLGFINPAIYALGKSASYSAVFNDVTAGNNSTNGTAPEFFAVPGYDLCTGWGSPVGGSLILALATPDRLVITPGTGFGANGPVGGPFSVTAQTLSLTNAGAGSINWSLSNTCLWLNVSPSAGTVTPGGAAATVAVSLNAAASSLPTGVYTANLRLTNNSTGLTQVRQFTVQVNQELVEDGGFESGDFAYWSLSGSDAPSYSYADDGSSDNVPPYAGNYFADLGQQYSLSSLSQTLPTRAGQPYMLSFWLECVDFGYGTTPNQFIAQWGGSTLLNEFGVGPSGWTNRRYVVAAAGPSTVLQFSARNDPGIFGLDEVSVVPLPLPNIQSVSQSGGILNLTWASMNGLHYQLQYKTNPTSSGWFNLGALTTATGSTLSATDTITPGSPRYYRVALVP